MDGPTPPYDAVILGFRVLTDVRSKLYLAQIEGRAPGSRTTWPRCLNHEQVLTYLADTIPRRYIQTHSVVIAMPHVTSIFSCGDSDANQRETNFYPTLYSTGTWENKPFSGACIGEMILMGAEAEFWARGSIDRWLSLRVPNGSLGKVMDTNKSRRERESRG